MEKIYIFAEIERSYDMLSLVWFDPVLFIYFTLHLPSPSISFYTGALPVLQTQEDEHQLMGSPGHLDTLHHQDDEEEEEDLSQDAVQGDEVVKDEVMEEEVEAPVEKQPKARTRRGRRSRHRWKRLF